MRSEAVKWPSCMVRIACIYGLFGCGELTLQEL